jgi:hypothetical protein
MNQNCGEIHGKVEKSIEVLESSDTLQWKEINGMKERVTKIRVDVALIVGAIQVISTVAIGLIMAHFKG